MLHARVGPMFAAKTRGLVEVCRDAARIGGPDAVVPLVPARDTRSRGELRAHDGMRCPAYAVSTIEDFQRVVYPRPDLLLVAVDEVQLFDSWIVRELRLLARRVPEVYVAGLLHDYRGAPFENTVELLLCADQITHVHARCVVCDAPAAFTHRKTGGGSRVQIGGAESYEARCRRHWEDVVEDPWAP